MDMLGKVITGDWWESGLDQFQVFCVHETSFAQETRRIPLEAALI